VITTAPQAAFSYDSTTFCQNNGTVEMPSFDGAAVAGVFTADKPGLLLDPVTGAINPATSTPDTYIVTNTIAAANGCLEVTASVTVIIIAAPVGTFNYSAPVYCQNEGTNPSPVLDGVAGTFTATPAGLVINSANGEIDLEASQPGTYTVTNTIAASAECSQVIEVTTVSISATPVFTFADGCENNVYSVEVIDLDGTFNPDAATYAWSGPGAFTSDEAFILPEETGVYTVTVTSAGCTSEQSFTVASTTCFIQKGISPGDAGSNNDFDLSALGVTRLSIFNRYGQEVFTYGNYTNQWHGQDKSGNELPTGTYFYSIERANGETKTGWVYINRQN